MKYCCVRYCDSKPRMKSGISFHEFPVNSAIRQKWISVVPQKGKCEGDAANPWDIQDSTKVCSLHFLSSDFKHLPKVRRLNPDAVPSIFPRPKRCCGKKRRASNSPCQIIKLEHDLPSSRSKSSCDIKRQVSNPPWQIIKLKQLKVVLDRDSVGNYLKKRALKEQKEALLSENEERNCQENTTCQNLLNPNITTENSVNIINDIADPISEHQYCKVTPKTNTLKARNHVQLNSELEIPPPKRPLQESNISTSATSIIQGISKVSSDVSAQHLTTLLFQGNNTPSTPTPLKEIVLKGTPETIQNLLLRKTPVILKNNTSSNTASKGGTLSQSCHRIKKVRHFGTQACFPVKSLEPYIKKYKLESRSAFIKISKLKRKVAALEKRLNADKELKLKLKKQMKDLNITQLEKDAQDVNNVHANFLLEQLKAYGSKSFAWQDVSVHHCMIWYHKYPESYRFVKQLNILKLPSSSTLERNGAECREIEFPSSLLKKKEAMNINNTVEVNETPSIPQGNCSGSSVEQILPRTICVTEDAITANSSSSHIVIDNQIALKSKYVTSKENSIPSTVNEVTYVPVLNTFLTEEQLSVIQGHKEGTFIETIELPAEVAQIVQHQDTQKLPDNIVIQMVPMP